MSAAGGDVPSSLASRYRSLRVLGQGGFGRVHAVRDLELGREVALKLLLAPENRDIRARFLREAETLATLRHPGVVEVYDFGEADGVPYLVMELLDGESLQDLGPGSDFLPPLLDAAAALEAVHAAGLVHRDVKPANILRRRDGRGVLIDFGILHDPRRTALTRTGMVLGTLGFLGPEMFRGGAVSPELDWYAWGASFYYLLEGRLPVTLRDLEVARERGFPTPEFSADHRGSANARACLACLDPEPDRRPRSRAEVEGLLGIGDPGSGPPATSLPFAGDLPDVDGTTRGVPAALVLASMFGLAVAAGAWWARPGGSFAVPAPPPEAAPASSPARRALAEAHATLRAAAPGHGDLGDRLFALVTSASELGPEIETEDLRGWPPPALLDAWGTFLDALDRVVQERRESPGSARSEPAPPDLEMHGWIPFVHVLEDTAVAEARVLAAQMQGFERLDGISAVFEPRGPRREVWSLARSLLEPRLVAPGADAKLRAFHGLLEVTGGDPAGGFGALVDRLELYFVPEEPAEVRAWVWRALAGALAGGLGAEEVSLDRRAAVLGRAAALFRSSPMATPRERLRARGALLLEWVRAARLGTRGLDPEVARWCLEEVTRAPREFGAAIRILRARVEGVLISNHVYYGAPLPADLAAEIRQGFAARGSAP